MKKTFVALLIFAMVAVFAGCGGLKPEQPVASGSGQQVPAVTQKQTGSEPGKMVSIKDFMDLMMSDLGKWSCPAQSYDFVLEFSATTGRNLVCMSKENMNLKTSDYLIAEIGSVTYNNEQKMYTVQLLQYDAPIENEVLHVDVSDIGKGLVDAENIYDNFKMVEYAFVAESGDFINGLISASGNFPTPEGTGQSDIIGVESESWIFRDDAGWGIQDAYKPVLSLDSAGYFSFKENLMAGMGHYYGVYTDTGSTIECTVYSIDFEGYAGDSVYEIVFEKTSPTTLTLQTDLCMSVVGTIFDLQ